MILLESILTTFIENFISEATKAVENIGLSLKSNHHKQI
jgi:hypothetical protein